MNRSSLSLEQTPPLSVPLIYMLTAPFFPVLVSIVLLVSPEIIVNRWDPAMIAVTHLLTLGFITMVMVGALQQLLPVLAGVQIQSPVAFSRIVYAGLLSGTVIMSVGFLQITPLLIGIGAVMLGLSFLWLILNLITSLLKSEANSGVTLGMKLAIVSFLLTLTLGLYLAAGYSLPEVSLQRSFTSLHIRWGLFGWIGILVFTISYQVVPMFQVTPKYPGAMIRWLAVAVILSLVSISLVESFALFSVNASNAVVLAFEAILLGGFASYALTTIMLQQQRRRKVPDVTMDFWRFGLLCLLLALTIMALSRTGQISHPRIDLVLGSLMIVGFTMSLITGMLYKIIPFLVWLHMTQTIEMSNRWELKIPNMKKIVSDKNARNQFRMHMLAVGLMLVALFVADLVRFAATVFMISNLYLAFNLISGALVFRRFVRM